MKLTPDQFDHIMEGHPKSGGSTLALESLWGSRAIARFMGVSVDFVRKLETDDTTFPVRRRGGRLYDTKSEIIVWLSIPMKSITTN